MRKALLGLVGLLCAALIAGVCDVSVTPIAAKVNEVPITVSTLNASLTSASQDKNYVCFLNTQTQAQANGGLQIAGAGSGTYASSFVDDQLAFLAEQVALHSGLSHIGIVAGPLAHEMAKVELTNALAPVSGSSCHATGADGYAELVPSFRVVFLQYFADESVLAAHFLGLRLTAAGVHGYEKAHPQAIALDCLNAILTTTAAKANEVVSQLQKGASFAAVARANSTDASASAGGRVGCVNPTQIVAPLNTAVARLKIGAISAPIAFEKKWVVLEVSSRSFPNVPQAALEAISSELSNKAFTDALDGYLQHAEVDVSPTYGKAIYSAGQITVAPPTGPNPSDIPNIGVVLESTS